MPTTGDLLVMSDKSVEGGSWPPAFRLTGPELTGWAGYDSFFNACLLAAGRGKFYTVSNGKKRNSLGRSSRKTLGGIIRTRCDYPAGTLACIHADARHADPNIARWGNRELAGRQRNPFQSHSESLDWNAE